VRRLQTGELQAANSASLHRVMVLGVFPLLILISAFFLAVHPVTDPDFWYHSAFGREFFRTWSIPRADVFSYTASGHPWISSGWISALALHKLYTTAGAAGPIVLVWLLVCCAALLVYYSAVKLAAPCAALVLLLCSMLASYPRFNPRPDILSQFMIVPLVLLLAGTEAAALQVPARHQKRLWFLPACFVAWANLHALFFLGLVVVAIYALWRIRLWRRDRSRGHVFALAACASCFVAWLLNPYGWRMVQFVYDNATLPKVGERVYELKPLLNAEALRGGLPIHILASILALLGIAGVCWWAGRKAIPWWRTAVVGVFVFLLFYQRRQIGLAGAALPALLVPNLAAVERKLVRMRPVAIGLPLLVAGLICGLRVAGALEVRRGLPNVGVDCDWFPCGAAKFLRENPAPRQLFHDLYTGGYLLHEIGPQQKVFIDGRLELYKGETWNDYFAPPEQRMTADQLFSKYGVLTALLDIRAAQNNPGHLANQLAAKPDWVPVYFDDQYCVQVHETSATQEYVRAHGFRFVNPLDWARMSRAGTESEKAQAAAEAQRALQMAGHSAAANTAAALAEYNRGNRGEGDKYLRRAQEIDPTIQLATQ
jgi:hypothetical protein